MDKRHILLTLVISLFCLSAWSQENNTGESDLSVKIGGTTTSITILNDSSKTVLIGNGRGAAIPASFTGIMTIPATIIFNDSIYSVVGIADSAFYACQLSGIVLPKTISSLGHYAFKQCENLRKVTLKSEQPFGIGTEAFDSIANDCVLYVPEGTLGAFHRAGWTSDLFGGGLLETGHDTENYCLENGVTSEYLKNVAYPDSDYSYTRITSYTYKSTTYKKGLPWPVRIEVPVTYGGESLVMETRKGEQLVRSDTLVVGQKFVTVWNLLPQCNYTYQLFHLGTDGEKSLVSEGTFMTEGQVRMMNIDGMQNFRDIGGWPLPGNRRVRYDRIYRSEELYYEPKSYFITQAGIHELLHVQGIGTEIDFGDDSDYSPLADSLEFIHGDDYQIEPYAYGIKSTYSHYKNCFEKVVEKLRQNEKVLFHCSFGADRTGTFAFLLEGLLGVSENDMAKDYELSNLFYRNVRCHRNDATRYKALVDTIKTNFAGETFHEKIEQMALSLGITQTDIDDFRTLMTVGTPGDSASFIKCGRPIISYDRGLLRFTSTTPGAQFFSKVTVADAQESNEAMIPLTARYEVTVQAIAEGYAPSDVVKATLLWGDGGLEVENMTIEATNEVRNKTGDVNNDGEVGIGDIVAITNIMAGKE